MQEPVSLRTRPYDGELHRRDAEARAALQRRRGPALHIALFAATFLTTMVAGASHDLWSGLPYAVAVMTILLFHECGHYFFARAHGVDATWPFFIPAPPIFFLGTLGAFIRMRSLPRDRRALFDIGAAGPWAGMLVAVPVLILGLALSEVRPTSATAHEAAWILGDSLLSKALTWLVLGSGSTDAAVFFHPIATAGWAGLLVTALNLLPVGQLDGGHVVYAAFGERWHRWISRGTLTVLIVLGLSGVATWLVWAVVLSVLGLRHPRLVDPETPLSPGRKLAAAATLLMFLVTFMPEPLAFSEPAPRIPRDEHTVPIGAPAPPEAPVAIPL